MEVIAIDSSDDEADGGASAAPAPPSTAARTSSRPEAGGGGGAARRPGKRGRESTATTAGTAGEASSRPPSSDSARGGGSGSSSRSGRDAGGIGRASTRGGDDHPRDDDEEGEEDDVLEVAPPRGTVDAYLGTWNVLMLMDRREFGQHSGSDFLERTERKINERFGGGKAHCERTTLPSADYLFVARLTSRSGETVDERILPLIIERKNVNDLQLCLITDSKKYRPLSFFEAQMYKLQRCGVARKLFLMEGDEDDPRQFSMHSAKTGTATPLERDKRLKRVKTVRLQIDRGEWQGVDVISTKSKEETVRFLIEKLAEFKRSFDPLRPPSTTMDDLKERIKEEMRAPTFREYLRLISQPRVGPVKAMKVINDPDLDWDKNFMCPSCTTRKGKSTLEDRASFWGESEAEEGMRNLSNAREAAMRSKKAGGSGAVACSRDGDPTCGICRKAVDIFAETHIATCNRVAACGATFHESCLGKQGYDIGKDDGCILCRAMSKFFVEGLAAAWGSQATAVSTTREEDVNGREAGFGKKSASSSASRGDIATVSRGSSMASLSRKGSNNDDFDDDAKGAKPKAKAKRARKDPNAPKRPMNCFMFYANSVRGQIRQENPHLSLGEVSKEIGMRFKAISVEERAKWQAKADAAREDYVRQLAEYKKLKPLEPSSGEEKNALKPPPSATPKNKQHASASAQKPPKSNNGWDGQQSTPEKIYMRRSGTTRRHTLPNTNATIIDRNGLPSNPLHDFDNSVAAALLLDEGQRPGQVDRPGQNVSQVSERKRKSSSVNATDDDSETLCFICNKNMRVWTDRGVVLCNRVIACGATFHEACLKSKGYDLQASDGCIKCKARDKFTTKRGKSNNNLSRCGGTNDNGANEAEIVVLDSDEDEEDDVIVID
ncbi:hypothetical protein ACHAWF_011782 [Thalassiosira exigua]